MCTAPPPCRSLEQKDIEWAPNCGEGYGCEGTGRWEPEHCKLPGASCVPLFHLWPDYTVWDSVDAAPTRSLSQCERSTARPDYGVANLMWQVGWIEQLINNLQLNFSVHYAGWEVYQIVRDATAANRPVLFYSWSPHELLASNRRVRITIPTCSTRRYSLPLTAAHYRRHTPSGRQVRAHHIP